MNGPPQGEVTAAAASPEKVGAAHDADALPEKNKAHAAGDTAASPDLDSAIDAEHGDHGWQHDSGLSLDPVQNLAADQLLDRARLAEPSITQSIREIAGKLDDGHLVGEEFRLKSESSLKEKLAGLIYDSPKLPLSKHLADIKDAVRYTIQTTGDSYSEAVRQGVSDLLAQGFDCLKFKNSWGSSGYQGINSFWIEPRSGQIFELQFHTAESFGAKMEAHAIYEEARLPTTTDLRRMELGTMQEEIFNKVPVPGHATELQIPRVEGSK